MNETSHGAGMRRRPGARTRRGLGALLLVVAAGMLGCGGGESGSETKTGTDDTGAKTSSTSTEKSGPIRIGVTLLTVQHAFYQELRSGLQEAAAPLGYELFITTGEFDPARQANQIDEFIVQRVDAIVVCPCDSRSVGASIVAANDAKIPVFTADIASTSGLGTVVSHIASDNRAGGRQAAELMARALSEKGQVAILTHPTVASVTDRVAGFKERLADFPGIEIVAELSAEGKRDKAVSVMEDLLQSHPQIDGVFGINDDSALGALAAIEAAGKVGRIKIVGYDATPEARERIADGAIFGDVIQSPKKIGELTIQAIQTLLDGGTPPAVIPVEVGVFTAES
ncbi:MAG: substrate-binding domain-containing protein [Candidatus Eisenbacteria bacterium]|uniref:Substrate-binding domain-containing protein n=1 Tax=Eiseniibacteriota bacterium TaxID=2212470 RepID=A0A956RQH3_UNCEI|nr:substrate-binding domain-containing protein [Candidatus Eisenbacteria bacterium]